MKSLRFSLRYLSKARGGNITRVISLTLGLAVSLLIFSYVGFILSFDRNFPDHERIYQVWTYSDKDGMGYSGMLHYPVAPSLMQDMPQVEIATHMFSNQNYDMEVDGSTFRVSLKPVDTCYCDLFGIRQISGDDPHQIFDSPDRIMISQSLAKSAFPGQNPMGKRVMVNKMFELTVAGVFENVPLNTSMGEYDMLVPLDMVIKVAGLGSGWNGGDSYYTYIKLKQGADISVVEAQIPDFLQKYGVAESLNEWGIRYIFLPISKSSFVEGGNESMIYLLSALAFLLLFVATMNYVLVSISGMVRRSRTIALLKCNGAHKNDVFRIFLVETAILILCALFLAVLIILAFAKPIEALTSYPVSELFALERIWAPASVLLAAFLLAGLIQARLFTKVPVEAAFKGVSDTNRRWKKILLGVEIACVTCVAALLLIASLQFRLMTRGDFGYEPDNLIYTRIMATPHQFERCMSELGALPEVESAGMSYSIPVYGYSGMPCVDENTHEILFSCRWELIDYRYIPAMKMKIVEGANFTRESSPTDVIVNQQYVRQRCWSDSPIGHKITDRQGDTPKIYTIVGVVRDFKMEATSEVRPIVLHPIIEWVNDDEEKYSDIWTMIRLRDMSAETIKVVTDKIRTFETSNNYRVSIYRETIDNQLSFMRSIRNIIAIGTIFTLIIALIGMLGYLSDECNRRAREVATRKVNGAEVDDILLLLCKNTIVMVIISVAVGIAIAYFAADKLMQQLPTRISLSWWIFAGTAAIVIIVVYAIQIIKTWRTANSNPSGMLKAE